MFEFELHDLIPYVFSISILYSFAYLYSAHVQTSIYKQWEQTKSEELMNVDTPMPPCRTEPIRHWLVRRVKRREAPDDDSSACISSFVCLSLYERGGIRWTRTMYSLGLKIVVSH